MKEIRKFYSNLKQAERYQNSLYNKYNEVQLVDFPRFSESGVYVWNVKI